MKIIRKIFLMMLFFAIISCNEKDRQFSTKDRQFADVKNLQTFKQTNFVATLEDTLEKNKNSIYSASLLFAWNELRKELKQPLLVDKSLKDLTLLNNSVSYLKTLNDDEFKVVVDINKDFFDNEIMLKASFSKSLVFNVTLQKFMNELTFSDQKVKSFGLKDYNLLLGSIFKILYFKDDDNFIISLLPNDTHHEIVLYKNSTENFKTFSEMLAALQTKIELGTQQRQNKKTAWRYSIQEEDKIVIPMFKFNIEHNYDNLENRSFNCNQTDYFIRTMYQRNAFLLDEHGARIESEGRVSLSDSVGLTEKLEKVQPKHMIFDKPFLLILKKIDNKNPYFAIWVDNAELMEKK